MGRLYLLCAPANNPAPIANAPGVINKLAIDLSVPNMGAHFCIKKVYYTCFSNFSKKTVCLSITY